MSLPGARTSYDVRLVSLAGIPVWGSPWFLLLVALVFSRAATFALGAVDLVAMTLSVLVHELGHAIPAKRRRLEPSIVLHGFGGYCAHAPARTRDDALGIAAGGPAAGLALGLAAYAVQRGVDLGPWWLARGVDDLVWFGIFWTAVNLVPALPLDGGAILLNLLRRAPTVSRPVQTARRVGVVAALVGLGVLGWGYGLVTGALLMGFLAFDNAAQLGWMPYLPGLALSPEDGPEAARKPPRVRTSWVPTPAVAVGLGLLGVAGALGAAVAPWDEAPAAVRATLWPLVWTGQPVPWVLVAAVGFLAGPAIERRAGWRGIVMGVALVTVVAGALGGAVAWATEGALTGPAPLGFALLATWAVSARGASSDGPLPVRPLILLVVVAIVGIVDDLVARDAARAVADLAAIGLGVWIAGQLDDPDSPWRRFELWWRLRNPPPIDLRGPRGRVVPFRRPNPSTNTPDDEAR